MQESGMSEWMGGRLTSERALFRWKSWLRLRDRRVEHGERAGSVLQAITCTLPFVCGLN